MVSSATTTIFGVLLFIASSHADIFPGDDRYHDICVEIFNYVNNNAIDFKHLIISCSSCTPLLQTREIQTRAEMCDKLTTQHNNHAASFLNSITITSLECQAALSNPDMYKAAEWNKWSGRHCGSWKNVDATTGAVTQTLPTMLSGSWQQNTTTRHLWRLSTIKMWTLRLEVAAMMDGMSQEEL